MGGVYYNNPIKVHAADTEFFELNIVDAESSNPNRKGNDLISDMVVKKSASYPTYKPTDIPSIQQFTEQCQKQRTQNSSPQVSIVNGNCFINTKYKR